jgi:hypothetical protein
MVQSQFEIGHISKPVGLAFEGFDFVIESFNKPGRDPEEEIVQKSVTMFH